MSRIVAVVAALTLGLAAPGAGWAAEEGGATETESGAQAGEGSAGADTGATQPTVEGSVNLGAVTTSGNTESESINGGLEAEIDYTAWRHSLGLAGYRASEDEMTVAERYSATLQSDYKISARSYLLVNTNYRVDRFGAFEERYAAALGVGRRFVDTARLRLDLEVGAGRRVQDPEGEPDAEGETIGRFNGEFRWQFSDSAAFKQTLEVESGDSNTYTESVTSIQSQLTGALALRLEYTIQNNSEVPANTEETDRIATVSVEYGF